MWKACNFILRTLTQRLLLHSGQPGFMPFRTCVCSLFFCQRWDEQTKNNTVIHKILFYHITDFQYRSFSHGSQWLSVGSLHYTTHVTAISNFCPHFSQQILEDYHYGTSNPIFISGVVDVRTYTMRTWNAGRLICSKTLFVCVLNTKLQDLNFIR